MLKWEWDRYEIKKKDLQMKLDEGLITHAEYRKALEQVCKKLRI